jgi:fucose 4-O-acetylase-like acetyltransferase
MKKRLIYPDVVKFVAIFLVTWSHCAQRVAGTIWTNFWGGIEFDLAMNMPLFMLISGWFINVEKIRDSNLSDYVFKKFKRLIIPSITWYFIHQLLSFQAPGFTLLKYYWYLNALFVCHCLILVVAKLFKSNYACIIISILVVLILPYTNFCHVNFMLPFLWAGYGLRKIFESKYRRTFAAVATILGFVIFPFWSHEYTDYRAAFNSSHFNKSMLMAYIYRFVIGFCLSTTVIYAVYILEKKQPVFSSHIAKLGQYSLIIYTMSMAILGFVKIVLNHYSLHTNEFVLIDILSLCLCVVIITLSIVFCDYCRKRKIISMLLLGE